MKRTASRRLRGSRRLTKSGLERFRRLRESGTIYEPLDVDLRTLPGGGLPSVRLDTGSKSFQTWVTVFPGMVLADLYDEHGSRLLELNVRSYLQARGKVNKGILETLRDCPEDFMAYNNGITVVAEEVVTGDLEGGHRGILALKGMQIVNGGQTTASIHRAAKEFAADLSRVFVQGKITVVDPIRFQDVVPLISKYSNTQNKISTSDLSANHAFHVGMERSLATRVDTRSADSLVLRASTGQLSDRQSPRRYNAGQEARIRQALSGPSAIYQGRSRKI